MANDIQIVIKAVDNASVELNKVKESLKGLGGTTSGLSSVNSALKKMASTSFGAISSGLSGIASSMASIAQQASAFALAQVGIMGMTAALDSGKQAFINYNADMEQARVSFTTLLKSADAAGFFIKQLQKLSDETPFDFPGVQKAGKMMLAFGFAAKDVVPTLRALSDASAGLSLGADGIQRMVLALGQMKNKGKVSGEEIRQLSEAGIGAEQILKNKFGKTVEEIQKSKISIDEVIRGLVQGIGEQFDGLSAKQAQTFTGLLLTLQDQSAFVAGAIGEPIFDALKEVLKETGDWVSELKKQIADGGVEEAFKGMFSEDWQNTLRGAKTAIEEAGSAIKNMVNELLNSQSAQDTFRGAINNAIELLGLLTAAARASAGAVRDVWSAMYSSNFKSEAPAWWNLPGQAAYQLGNLTSSGAYSEADAQSSFLANRKAKSSSLNYVTKNGQRQMVPDVPFAKTQFDTGTWAKGLIDSAKPIAEKFSKKYHEEVGKSLVNNSKGSPSSGGSSSGGGSGSDKTIREINRIQSAFEQLNTKIIGETGTTYEKGFARINDEMSKMQRELVDKAKSEGLDTSALEAKMKEYARVMTEPITRAWREAWMNMRNETALITAKMLDDKKGQAEAEFQIAVAGFERQKREKMKALGTGGMGDMAAQIEINNRYNLQVANAAREKAEKDRAAEIEKYNMKIEYNQLDLELNRSTQDQIDVLNRQEMLNKKAYLIEQLNDERLTFQERLAMKKELAATESNMPANTLGGALGKGMQETANSWGSWFKNIQEVGKQTAQSMQQAFSDFFFDAMTGKLKDLGDYLKSFLQGVARAISNALANAFAQKLIGGLFGGMFGGRAAGGPVSAGTPYVVGERGPEIFIPSGNGNIIPNHAIGGNNAAPVVNVYNNTGTKAEVKSEVQFDGSKYVVGVWLDAFARDEGGLRTVLGGAR